MRKLVIPFALALSIAGCGGGDEGSSAGGSEDGGGGSSKAKACDLLTQQAAQRAAGGPVKKAPDNPASNRSSGGTDLSSCTYTSTSADFRSPTITLLVRSADADESRSAFESNKSTYKGKDVSGLGDAAYRTASPSQLNILKGGTWMIITASAGPKARPDIENKAARDILRNL